MSKYAIEFEKVSPTVYLAKNTHALITRAKEIVTEISSTNIQYEPGYTDRILYIIVGRMISTEFITNYMEDKTTINKDKTFVSIQVDGLPNEVTISVGYMTTSDKTNIYVNGVNII